MGKLVRNSLDKDKFVRAKQAGLKDAEAYIAAGGTAANPTSAGYKYKNSPTVQVALSEATKSCAIDAMLSLTTLTELAVDHYRDVLTSTNAKDKSAKNKVALDVIQRTRDLLPKEIKTTHEVSIDDESQEVFKELAAFLLSNGGANATIVEAIETRADSGVAEVDAEESLTTEYTVHSEQETSSSS